MSEHINGSDTQITSGGHIWQWSDPAVHGKAVGAAGLKGEYSMVTSIGARSGRITGRRPAPGALLKAANDAALNTLEAFFEGLAEWGAEVNWEDDQGHSGSALVIVRYRRIGTRIHGSNAVWQYYVLTFRENNGGW